MTEELAKAIFAAAFNLGFGYGTSHAAAHDWGELCSQPDNPKDAWATDIAWRIDGTEPGADFHLDITNPNDWNKIQP